MTLEELNKIDSEEAVIELTKCCGAHHWVDRMVSSRPFEDQDALFDAAEEFWFDGGESDWLEAFTHHPKIGDVESLSEKYANTKAWAGTEQKSVDTAPLAVVEKLAELNALYEHTFGFIFIVCATGKTAEEMLEILESRIGNEYQEELKIAMVEQYKITTLRMKKLIVS